MEHCFDGLPATEVAGVTDTPVDSYDSYQSGVLYTEVINVIVSSVGTVANTFAILVLLGYKKLRRRVGNWLLVNQSILDLLASIAFWVYHMNNIFTGGSYKAPYLGVAGDLYCRLWANGISNWVLVGASAYNLLGITLERYWMVVHPLYHKVQMTGRRVTIMCAAPWVFSFTYGFAWGAPTSPLEGDTCMSFAKWPSVTWVYVFGVMELFNFLIPVVSLSSMYIRMAVKLRSSVGPVPVVHGSADKGGHHLSKAQRNLTKTCIIVVVFFILLWSPNQISVQF